MSYERQKEIRELAERFAHVLAEYHDQCRVSFYFIRQRAHHGTTRNPGRRKARLLPAPAPAAPRSSAPVRLARIQAQAAAPPESDEISVAEHEGR